MNAGSTPPRTPVSASARQNSLGSKPPEMPRNTGRATVSFEIPIDRVECKFKLSQNRPLADRKRVVDALEQSGKSDDGAVAGLMRKVGVLEEE